jgi:cell growth-regulating nucleolar protein
MFTTNHVEHISCLSEKQLYWGPYANVRIIKYERVKNQQHNKMNKIKMEIRRKIKHNLIGEDGERH